MAVRCPSLRVDRRARPRLIEIISNLNERIQEAKLNGWLGEVQGLQASLTAAADKLVSLDRICGHSSGGLRQITDLGIPVIKELSP